MKPVLEVKELSRSFRSGENELHPLRGANLQLYPKDFVAVVGASGTGKSTLLNVITGLDTPDEGRVFLHGKDISQLSQDDLARLRLQEFGIVFQFFNLLPGMTLRQNISVPGLLLGTGRAEVTRRVEKLIEQVGLGKVADHMPHQVSGGETQRAAIARALVNNPSCILADEPTGNLDPDSANSVLCLFKELLAEHDAALLIVTHDQRVRELADRTYTLEHGKLTL